MSISVWEIQARGDSDENVWEAAWDLPRVEFYSESDGLQALLTAVSNDMDADWSPQRRLVGYTLGKVATAHTVSVHKEEMLENCGCEHVDHEEGRAHPMFGVPAGHKIASYVGAICDDCANGHLSHYVLGSV